LESQEELSSSIFNRSLLLKDDVEALSLILGSKQSSNLWNRLAWQPSILKIENDGDTKIEEQVEYKPFANFAGLGKLLYKFFKCYKIGVHDLKLTPHELALLKSVIMRKFAKTLKIE